MTTSDTPEAAVLRHIIDFRDGKTSGEEMVVDILTAVREIARVHVIDFDAALLTSAMHAEAEREYPEPSWVAAARATIADPRYRS